MPEPHDLAFYEAGKEDGRLELMDELRAKGVSVQPFEADGRPHYWTPSAEGLGMKAGKRYVLVALEVTDVD